MEAVHVPNPAERELLGVRLESLQRALQPAAYNDIDRKKIAASVLEMVGMNYASMINADRQKIAAAYVVELQDLPAWAVERACLAVRRGKVPDLNPDFPPSAPRLHQIAEAEMKAVRAEKEEISSVLALEVRK